MPREWVDLRLWDQLNDGRFLVFGWVRSPDGTLFHANFDDGYLYTQGDEFRYGPGTRNMSSVDPTGWTIAEAPLEA